MGNATKLYHLIALGFYLYVLNHLQTRHSTEIKDENPTIKNVRRFSPRFLTNWTFTLQGIYFALCTLINIISVVPKSQKLREKINKVSNFIFTAIATPAAVMVTIVFWGLYIVDRELIFPKELDSILPPWLNHSIHSVNSLLALGDMYLVHHKYPSWGNVIKALLLYYSIYAVCLFGTYYQTGIWLYPFLEKLTWTQRAVASVVIFLSALSFFAMTKFLHGVMWGAASSEKTKKSNKHKAKKHN